MGSPLGGGWTLTSGTKGCIGDASDPDFTKWFSTGGKGGGPGWYAKPETAMCGGGTIAG